MGSRTYSIRVEGLPPKKDGANSMWAKPSELPRLISLRSKVLEAFGGQPPLQTNISLNLEVHVGPKNEKWTGDLDNFITGICDGLMAAHNRRKHDITWDHDLHEAIHPEICIGIVDDSQVVRIEASKVVGDTEEPWYLLQLSGE